jgi:hypothetical protein
MAEKLKVEEADLHSASYTDPDTPIKFRTEAVKREKRDANSITCGIGKRVEMGIDPERYDKSNALLRSIQGPRCCRSNSTTSEI